MSANAATSDFGDYAPAAHTDEDDLGVGSPHATTSSSSSSSRTSFSVENSPTTGRISGDETLPATASGLCRHFCSLHSSVMCVHVVSVFAAIHINHLLKTLVSPDDDNHGNVVAVTVALFFLAYAATNALARRCMRSPRSGWTVGLVGGHIMGFSTKQIYVATVRAAIRSVSTVSVGVVWLSIPPLALYVLALRRARECVTYARGCASSNETTVQFARGNSQSRRHWRRRKAVISDALEDAYAVALGFALFAAIFGTATYVKPHSLNGVFEVEKQCYRYSHGAGEESSSNSTSADTEDQSLSTTPATATCVLVMILVCPAVAFLLRQKGRRLMIKYLATSQSRGQRKGRQLACAEWLQMLSTALAFAMGLMLNKLISSFLESAAERDETTNADMLALIASAAVAVWWVSTLSQTSSSITQTLRERAMAGSATGGTAAESACTQWRIRMLVPTLTRMWIIYVALSFESFFDCMQYQIVHTFHWSKTVAQITFFSVGMCALVVVTLCCGGIFADRHEEEMAEAEEMAEEYRRRRDTTSGSVSSEWHDGLLAAVDSASDGV